jgi:YesN/AraC family two-component response regulator
LHVYYQEEITLSTLAARFNRNASYISRLFRQNVGQTFTEYLHSLRIGRATGLLATTSMSITDIAMEVGFDQSRTFTRVFKEIKGMTPKQYRAAYQIRETAQKEFTDNRRQK